MQSFMFTEPFTVTAEYVRATTHNVYGKAVISVTPAPSFSFRSKVVWPHEDYQDAVLKSILEVLHGAGVSHLGIELILEEIGWRDDEYCWDGYYQAGKKAAAEILDELKSLSDPLPSNKESR